jgi:starvation-inducible DNA-binding protein
MQQPDIGIDPDARERIHDVLAQVLADTYTLYAKTHAYHWNVTGPQFPALHQMFETQYTDLWGALDDLAERLRALGAFAPGPADVAARSTIKADNGRAGARQMVLNLLEGHEVLSKALKEGVGVADAAGDEGTADLLTERLRFSEKTAWMLRATAEDV